MLAQKGDRFFIPRHVLTYPTRAFDFDAKQIARFWLPQLGCWMHPQGCNCKRAVGFQQVHKMPNIQKLAVHSGGMLDV
jgi:hypothetical protein